jgi:hypothetical protein
MKEKLTETRFQTTFTGQLMKLSEQGFGNYESIVFYVHKIRIFIANCKYKFESERNEKIYRDKKEAKH